MTFLDAVVAIAITLLVLPLVDLLGNDSERDLGALLIAHQAQFGSFLLSFVVIANAWLSHHRLIERVGDYDEAFLLLNLAWMLTVVVLPFSAQVIADFKTQRLSVAIYLGTVALNSAMGTALALLVHRRPALRREGHEAGHGSNTLASLVTTGLVFLALVVGVALPAVNFFALLLLLLARPLIWLIRHVHPQDLIRRLRLKTER
ncbi:MAG: TMEM175 family protein [Lapillicoccus sp.]